MDNVPVEKINEFEKGLLEYFDTSGANILKEIKEKKELSEELEKKIKDLVNDYKGTVDYIMSGDTK